MHPVQVNVRMSTQRTLREEGSSSDVLDKVILVRSQNLVYLPPESTAKALVLNLDSMLPRQRLHLSAAQDGAIFQQMCEVISDWKAAQSEGSSVRLGMAGYRRLPGGMASTLLAGVEVALQ